MQRWTLTVLAVLCLAVAPKIVHAGDDTKGPLEGVWVAQSMEAEGKPAPADAVKRMRFTFKGDKLLIKGNFADDREDECTFKVDTKVSPKQLDFTPPKDKKKILGIYEVKEDELKICMRQNTSDAGRPTEFVTKPESRLVLIVFKKQKD